MSLIVQAISNEDVFDRASVGLRLKITNALIHAFLLYLNGKLIATLMSRRY